MVRVIKERKIVFELITIQDDSLCVFQLLEKLADLDHQHVGVIDQYKELKQRDWSLTIYHVYKEANFLADHLANSGHSLPLGTHIIYPDDPDVVHWSNYDKERSSRGRLIRASMRIYYGDNTYFVVTVTALLKYHFFKFWVLIFSY
ncbi:hypothetical protein LINPERPRIM_LOCUS2216 [Linum perenne]